MSTEDGQARQARAVDTLRRRYSMLGFGSMTRLVLQRGNNMDVYARYSLVAAYQGMALTPILFKRSFADRCNHLL